VRGLLAACLVLAGSAAAEETDPAKRHAAAVRGFGVPGAGAFRFEGEMFADGKPYGSCVFAAEPACLPGKSGTKKDHWHVSEVRRDLAGEVIDEAEAYLAKDLQAVCGKVAGRSPSVTWRRSGKKLEWVGTLREGATPTHKIDVDAYDTATIAGAILFTRLASTLEDRYAARTLVDGTAAADLVWNYQGPARWCGVKATLVSCRIDRLAVFVALDPGTNDVLGLLIVGESPTIWCLAKGKGLVAPARHPILDVTARVADSPVEAAVQGSLWFQTGDKALGLRCIHWPTVYRKFGGRPALGLTVEQFRDRYLDDHARARAGLPDILRKLALEHLPDGHVRMRGPDTALVDFGSITYKVIKVNGVWYYLVPGADR
jgi:hypothetical protein